MTCLWGIHSQANLGPASNPTEPSADKPGEPHHHRADWWTQVPIAIETCRNGRNIAHTATSGKRTHSDNNRVARTLPNLRASPVGCTGHWWVSNPALDQRQPLPLVTGSPEDGAEQPPRPATGCATCQEGGSATAASPNLSICDEDHRRKMRHKRASPRQGKCTRVRRD